MKSKCPYCQSSNYQYLYSTYDIFENHYELVDCKTCSAVFLTPNPSEALLAKAYDDSYYGGSEEDEKFEGFVEKGLQFFRKRRAKHVASIINNTGNVLDIGCGNGQFLKQVSAFGDIQIYGTEMPGSSARRASKLENIHLHVGELSSEIFSESFDLISLFHVFEHLLNPQQYLDTIDEVLKPGAYLLLSFPNIDSWQARFFKSNWLHLDPPRHLFFFKTKTFKALMDERGYDCISEKYFSIEQNPFGAIQSWFNRFHEKRELLFEYLKGNQAYVKDIPSWKLKIEKFLFLMLTPGFMTLDLVASCFKKGATVEMLFKKRV